MKLTSLSNNAEKVWVWNTGDSELFFDRLEVVRFRVEHEFWNASSRNDSLNDVGLVYKIIVSPRNEALYHVADGRRGPWRRQALGRRCGGTSPRTKANLSALG